MAQHEFFDANTRPSFGGAEGREDPFQSIRRDAHGPQTHGSPEAVSRSAVPADRHQFSAPELGELVHDGFASHNYTAARRELGAAVQQAFNTGGLAAADAVVRDVDSKVPINGVGTLLTNEGGKVQAHIVEAGPSGYSDNQMRTAGYFQKDGGWYRDLAKPVDINTQPFEGANRRADAATVVNALRNNAEFARTGRLNEQTASAIEGFMSKHVGDIGEFNQQINEMLKQQNVRFRLEADVTPGQPGLHGNTVNEIRVQSFGAQTGERINGFRTAVDTVRSLSAPERRWD